jgi:hypothetical protein
MVQSKYSSDLTTDSSTYARRGSLKEANYFYQAIQINVSLSGYYTIVCTSSMDTYGYIYINAFDPIYPPANLLSYDDDSGGDHQFMFKVYLQILTEYILVSTTHYQNITGSFTITAIGPELVSFSQLDISSKN